MREIILTGGQIALVDDCDYEWVSQDNWLLNHSGYAVRSIGKKRMHRLIMRAPDGQQVDHVDGNRLNNQKSNLRFATPTEQSRNTGLRRDNTSGYKGVGWHKQLKKWRANIIIEGRQLDLGVYENKEVAAVAYDLASLKYFGNFACTNHPAEELLILRQQYEKELYPIKTSKNCTSQYRGVSWCARRNRWIAQIRRDGKQTYLRSFREEINAAEAYDQAAREVFGIKAKLNFSNHSTFADTVSPGRTCQPSDPSTD